MRMSSHCVVRTTVVGSVIALGLLSACAEDSGPSVEPPVTPRGGDPSADGATTTPKTGEMDVAEGLPGTRVAFGTPLRLPITVDVPGSTVSGVIESTVTDVQEADGSYLDSFAPEAVTIEIDEGDVAYFIRAEHVVLEADGTPNPVPPDGPSAIYPEFDAVIGDEVAGRVVISGPGPDPCVDETSSSFGVGATATTCDVVFAPPGADVEAAWLGETRLDIGPFPAYEADPVVWE